MKNVDMFIKRTVCVLFVLLTLSVGLFAGFSGTTGMTLSYDFDDNSFGFDGKNTSAKFDFNLLGVSDISGGDGSVKAQVEAYLTLDYSFENTNFAGKDGFNFSLGDVRGQFRIEDASIYGPGWEFSLVWIPGQLDYAKSPIDYTVNADDTLNNATTQILYNKAPGVYFKWNDNEIGFGIEGDLDNLNVTMCEVSTALETINGEDGDKEGLKQIVEDTSETVANLKKFSEKLNKRFLLFRLMF